jgi:hypothetical protein
MEPTPSIWVKAITRSYVVIFTYLKYCQIRNDIKNQMPEVHTQRSSSHTKPTIIWAQHTLDLRAPQRSLWYPERSKLSLVSSQGLQQWRYRIYAQWPDAKCPKAVEMFSSPAYISEATKGRKKRKWIILTTRTKWSISDLLIGHDSQHWATTDSAVWRKRQMRLLCNTTEGNNVINITWNLVQSKIIIWVREELASSGAKSV